MNEEELKFVFPPEKSLCNESKETIQIYKKLISKMEQDGDNDIVGIGDFYPMWIIDLCRRATTSITAFSEDKDVKIFQFLQKELSNPNLYVNLIINNEPSDIKERQFIARMNNMERLKISHQGILAGTSLVVDETHFLIKQDKERDKKYFWGAFYQPEISKKIQDILITHWSAIPKRTTSHIPIINTERSFTK